MVREPFLQSQSGSGTSLRGFIEDIWTMDPLGPQVLKATPGNQWWQAAPSTPKHFSVRLQNCFQPSEPCSLLKRRKPRTAEALKGNSVNARSPEHLQPLGRTHLPDQKQRNATALTSKAALHPMPLQHTAHILPLGSEGVDLT